MVMLSAGNTYSMYDQGAKAVADTHINTYTRPAIYTYSRGKIYVMIIL